MATVLTLTEGKRGCGYRQPDKTGVGIYLMGPGVAQACERLPFPLVICSTCGGGIKFSRGFTWITPRALFPPLFLPECSVYRDGAGPCYWPKNDDPHFHSGCLMCNPPPNPAALLWVGEAYYSPESFAQEAREVGISKKIPAVPRDFKVGETVAYLAHKKAVTGSGAGIFAVFRPTHVDLVIDDAKNVPERAEKIAARLGNKARIVKIVEAQETLL